MQIILSDHNCEGHAEALFEVLKYRGWLAMIPMKLLWFRDVGLSDRASDEKVWCFCQQHNYLLLTGNRTTTDKDDSLEIIIRRLITPENLPVVTIGNLKRLLAVREYRERCAIRLAEIVLDLEKVRGVTRLFIP